MVELLQLPHALLGALARSVPLRALGLARPGPGAWPRPAAGSTPCSTRAASPYGLSACRSPAYSSAATAAPASASMASHCTACWPRSYHWASVSGAGTVEKVTTMPPAAWPRSFSKRVPIWRWPGAALSHGRSRASQVRQPSGTWVPRLPTSVLCSTVPAGGEHVNGHHAGERRLLARNDLLQDFELLQLQPRGQVILGRRAQVAQQVAVTQGLQLRLPRLLGLLRQQRQRRQQRQQPQQGNGVNAGERLHATTSGASSCQAALRGASRADRSKQHVRGHAGRGGQRLHRLLGAVHLAHMPGRTSPGAQALTSTATMPMATPPTMGTCRPASTRCPRFTRENGKPSP